MTSNRERKYLRSYSDERSTSFDSDLDQIDDYELEVEVLDSPLEGPSPSQEERNIDSEDGATTNNGAVLPYDDEPIADEERFGNMNSKKSVRGFALRLFKHD